MARERNGRPPKGELTFACVPCALVLDDGVDYAWCPKCSGAVDWIDPTETTWICKRCDNLTSDAGACACGRMLVELPRPTSPRAASRAPLISFEAARRIYVGIFAAVVVTLLFDPRLEPWLRLILFTAQLASLVWIGLAISGSRELRALIRDRETRIVHGLEHATINVLEQRGLTIRSGLTYQRWFVLEVDHDGRWWERVDEVRAAVTEAIARIRGGERQLAYHPRCGTSLLVATIVVAISIAAAGLVGLVLGLDVIEVAIATVIALAGARVFAKPLGLLAQQAWTVSTELASARVVEITRHAVADASGLELVVRLDVVACATGPAAAVSPIGP